MILRGEPSAKCTVGELSLTDEITTIGNAAHLQRLEGKKARISQIMKDIVEKDVLEICQSEDSVAVSELPSVSKQFKAALLKHLTADATSPLKMMPAGGAAHENSRHNRLVIAKTLM